MTDISKNTKSLIEASKKILGHTDIYDSDFIDVSKTVSFFAIAYEKFRNVIELKDEHIIRRNAINRIISRRMAFNPDLVEEAASIAKEIAWGGYYKQDKIPESYINRLEKAINWYMALRNQLIKGENGQQARFYASFVKDLLVCQTEEIFSEKQSQLDSTFLFYFYQVYTPNIIVEGMQKDQKDLLFYIAFERVFIKSDNIYLRFHLFKLIFEHLLKVNKEDFVENLQEFKKAFQFVEENIDKPINRKIINYLKNVRPAYLILKDLITNNLERLDKIFADEKKLTAVIDALCREKYQKSQEKLSRAGVRSFMYILLTKIIFVFIAEYPIMARMGEGVDMLSLGINAAFPPILMAMFVLLSSVPGPDNTERISKRIKHIVLTNEIQKVVFKIKKVKEKNFLFSFFFWTFYFTTFAVTFLVINFFLDLLGFHWLSKVIFFFFASGISFFGYRIRLIAKEYVIKEKDSIFTPIIDFFMMPLVSVGKWLSSEIARINFLLFIFDFLIEAPFKVLFEVIEEWISFVKRRKEDIV